MLKYNQLTLYFRSIEQYVFRPANPIHNMTKTRTRAVYQDGVLRPLDKLNLRQGEEVEIEITNVVRRTKGIIKIDPALGKEIAESDELSNLES